MKRLKPSAADGSFGKSDGLLISSLWVFIKDFIGCEIVILRLVAISEFVLA
jgi:hypothetical protein